MVNYMSDSFSKQQIDAMPASLGGRTVMPINGASFQGVILVPKRFFLEGETDLDAVQRYLSFLDEEDAKNSTAK